MIKIYDNIIPIETQVFIEQSMTDTAFPWFLTKGTVDAKEKEYLNCYLPNNLIKDHNVREYIQFIHMFYTAERQICSPAYNTLILPMFEKFCIAANIEWKRFLRIKANFQTQCNFSNEQFVNMPHIDTLFDHRVALYYVNDSDGDTVFFNSDGTIMQTITPKRGRFVVFDGIHFHAGRHPILSEKRVVINFDFQ
jgi:hypothetical protein